MAMGFVKMSDTSSIPINSSFLQALYIRPKILRDPIYVLD